MLNFGQGKEKTLIMCSHILQEVQAVCDRIVILNKGIVVADGSAEELKSSFQNRTKMNLELTASQEEIIDMVNTLQNISIVTSEAKENFTSIDLEFDATVDRRAEIYEYIKSKNWTLYEMHRVNVSLEAVFRNLTIEGGE